MKTLVVSSIALLTITYSNAQVLTKTSQMSYNWVNQVDNAKDVVVDSDNFAYSTGCMRSGGSDGIYVRCEDIVGDENVGTSDFKWSLNPPAYNNSSGTCIAVDEANGALWVAGYENDGGSNKRWFVWKFNSGDNGNTILASFRFRVLSGQNNIPNDIKVGSDGNPVVTGGMHVTNGTHTDVYTVKIDGSLAGVQPFNTSIWANSFDGPSGETAANQDRGTCVVLDASDNVYVGGTARHDILSNGANKLMYRQSYTAAGGNRWGPFYYEGNSSGPGYNKDCSVDDCDINDDGTVVAFAGMANLSTGTTTGPDGVCLLVDASNGNSLSTMTKLNCGGAGCNGGIHGPNQYFAVDVVGTGTGAGTTAYCTGYMLASGTYYIINSAYHPNWGSDWEREFSVSGGIDYGVDIKVSCNTNTVFVAANQNGGANYNWRLMEIDPVTGNENAFHSHNLGANDIARAMDVSTDGHVYVIGQDGSSGGDFGGVGYKTSDDCVIPLEWIEDPEKKAIVVGSTFELLMAQHNITDDQVDLKFNSMDDKITHIELRNALGQLVTTQKMEAIEGVNHYTLPLYQASGVLILSIRQGDKVRTKLISI